MPQVATIVEMHIQWKIMGFQTLILADIHMLSLGLATSHCGVKMEENCSRRE